MKIEIEMTPNGEFDVVKLVPEILGTFPKQDTAEQFIKFLTGVAKQASTATPERATSSVSLRATDGRPDCPYNGQNLATGADVGAKKPLVNVAPKSVPPSSAGDWTDLELEAAYECLRAGEKLKTVAEQAGKSWTTLRAKWASLKSCEPIVQPAAAAATVQETAALPAIRTKGSVADLVTSAIDELNSQAICVGCSKRFTASADNLDTCARCSR